MWSSWVKENDTTQVMYITKLKGGPKRVKKIFSMIWKGFRNGMMDGEKMESYKKENFDVKVFFSSRIIDFLFYLKRLLELFFNTFFLFLSMLHLLGTWGFR
jgi:hypothetical protein